MTNKAALSPFELAALAANIADSKKASDILVLETGKVSHLADYFVICTGESAAQIRSIADEVERQFKQSGLVPIGQEQDKTYKWYLLDYGDVVVHLMNSKERQFYQLEHFWNHATVVEEEKWLHKERQAS